MEYLDSGLEQLPFFLRLDGFATAKPETLVRLFDEYHRDVPGCDLNGTRDFHRLTVFVRRNR